MKEALTTVFYVMKWIFLFLTIIGLGHYIFELVVFIQIIPIFLMLNMSLPSNISSLLEGMLSFQVKNIVPILEISSDYSIYFPHLTYDYYHLFDYFMLCKLGDIIIIVFLNILTKFDEGFVRMFPSGKIRRFLYETLVRRGYSVFSLGLLSIQPSFLLLCAVYLKWMQWE